MAFLKKVYDLFWKREPVQILVAGTKGTGKSALINGMVGSELAGEGGFDLDQGTTEVKSIQHVLNDVNVLIWDTPGLQDTIGEGGDNYMKKLRGAGCGKVDLILYCSKMDDIRIRQDDIEAIKKLTYEFCPDIWKHALIVLTFANRVKKKIKGESNLNTQEKRQIQKEFFKKCIQEWKIEYVRVLMEAGVPEEVAAEITFIPAGFDERRGLPDRKNWVSPLWHDGILHMKPSPQSSLLRNYLKLLKPPETLDDDIEEASVSLTTVEDYLLIVDDYYQLPEISGDSDEPSITVPDEFNPEKWTKEKSVRILITGKTGMGKSLLINGIVGAEVAEEGSGLKRGTSEVKAIEHVRNDVKLIIWDTPGLQDVVEKKGEYVKMMQDEGCADADLVLYCTRMDDSRLRHDDIEAIMKLTYGFGNGFWKHALFVLTFANKVEKMIKRKKGEQKLNAQQKQEIQREYFKQRIQEWKTELDQALEQAGVPKEIIANIIPVPAGYDGEVGLPDRENWLSPLWYACIFRMKPSSQAGLLKANLDRIKRPQDLKEEDFDQPLSEQPIIFTGIPPPIKYGAPPAILTAIGAAVGTAIGIIGGPPGMAIGGAAGGAAGAGLGGVVSAITAYFSTTKSKTTENKTES